jgi:hypothetical protein
MFQQWKIVTMKKTLRPLGGELQQEMLCVYISYTACGDQVKCNSLFREQEG